MRILFLSLILSVSALSAEAQQPSRPSQVPLRTTLMPHSQISVSTRATCLEYIDLYTKVVVAAEQATLADEEQFQNLVSLTVGYITGLQNAWSVKIINPARGFGEWQILEEMQNVCTFSPDYDILQAIHAVDIVYMAQTAANDAVCQRCQGGYTAPAGPTPVAFPPSAEGGDTAPVPAMPEVY